MDKKEEIFKVVLQLTSDQGLWDTPMSQIAKHANMAVGSIYHHFKSKEQLLSELYLNVQAQIAEVFSPQTEFDSFQEEFKRIFTTGYCFLVQHPYLFRYAVQVGNSPLVSPAHNAQVKNYFASFYNFFQLGINQGKIQAGNHTLVSQFVFSQIMALAQIQLDGQLFITPVLQQQAVDRAWKGIQ